MNMSKVVRVGKGAYGSVFCKIKIEDGDGKETLSISGVEGPTRDGNAKGSCGQIGDGISDVKEFAPGWNRALAEQLALIWEQWHLNDMRAGCVHQRELDVSEKVEVVSYKLTQEALRLREATIAAAAKAQLTGTAFSATATAKALATLDDWHQDVFTPPDADSPLSDCYVVSNREVKTAGWVRPSEHPKGLLGRPCTVCGYKYGSQWLYEPLPQSVKTFLMALPDTDLKPAWV